MQHLLTERHALITGGASGIGNAIVRRFLAEGAQVSIVDRDRDALDRALAELSPDDRRFGVPADVRDPRSVRDAVNLALERFGPIDVLVNNAGIASSAPFLEITEATWVETLDVNLKGAFLVAQTVARHMVRSERRGSIINMSSTNGLVGEPGYAPYDASKAGLANLTRTMALELGRNGIRVNALCPGYIVTPMSGAIDDEEFVADYIERHIPLGRTGTPEDVAAAATFLAGEDSSFITGTMLVIDGGQLAS